MPIRVKVCCIQTPEEAKLAVAQGASAIGLVSSMPSGPGVIPEDQIAQIAETLPPQIGAFLLTSLTDADEIMAQHRRCKTNAVQLCEMLDRRAYLRIRRKLPDLPLIQVLQVTGEDSVAEAERIAPHVDALLLDSGDRTASPKRLGGTGETHDWSISRKIRDKIAKPIFLAGGLGPSNIIQAIRTVEPYGVDVCSGVRSDHALDETKLSAFFAAITAIS